MKSRILLTQIVPNEPPQKYATTIYRRWFFLTLSPLIHENIPHSGFLKSPYFLRLTLSRRIMLSYEFPVCSWLCVGGISLSRLPINLPSLQSHLVEFRPNSNQIINFIRSNYCFSRSELYNSCVKIHRVE